MEIIGQVPSLLLRADAVTWERGQQSACDVESAPWVVVIGTIALMETMTIAFLHLFLMVTSLGK